MDKVSTLDLDSILNKIIDNELGIILLEADVKSIYGVLAKETSYKDRQGLFGSDCHITFHLFPIMYNSNEDTKWTKCRGNAIDNIFARWTKCGYNKHHAKSPFGCKAFFKYLEKIEFLQADYMLMMVE